jgi:hypothetical protein
MIRSTQDDMQHRSETDKYWMDFAVVDSLPFLYFLQYKIYGHLQSQQDQQRALYNLVNTTMFGKNLGHRETALNLIGQCMEQENKPMEAMRCYMLSLQQRERNNVAKFHICNLLRKHVSQNWWFWCLLCQVKKYWINFKQRHHRYLEKYVLLFIQNVLIAILYSTFFIEHLLINNEFVPLNKCSFIYLQLQEITILWLQ